MSVPVNNLSDKCSNPSKLKPIVIALGVTLALTACAQAGQQGSEPTRSAGSEQVQSQTNNNEGEAPLRDAPKAEVCLASSDHQQGVDSSTMAHELARIQTELALTDEHRARGLMHREHLAPEEGMLFYYPNSQYRSFWMFNTLIPLDIAYLADDGEILQIITMEPCLSDNPGRCKGYQSDGRARAALELNARAFAELGVGVGDYVLEATCQHSPWAAGW